MSDVQWIASELLKGVDSAFNCKKKGGIMIRLRIKEIAEQKKVSQGLLSRKANLDVNTVREVMRDEHRNITLETLNRLANGLQVDAKELIEYTPDPPE